MCQNIKQQLKSYSRLIGNAILHVRIYPFVKRTDMRVTDFDQASAVPVRNRIRAFVAKCRISSPGGILSQWART